MKFYNKLLIKVGMFLLLLVGAGSLTVCAKTPEEPIALEPIGIFSDPYSDIRAFSTDESRYYPKLKEGNHVQWIDRIELPEYAENFSQLLLEGSDYDGISDFLINADSSDLVENIREYVVDEVNGTPAKGIKVADIYASGSSWEEAMELVYEDFYDKYYKIRAVYEAFDRDHPEVFWLNSGCYITTLQYDYYPEFDETTRRWKYIYTSELYFVLESEAYDWKIWVDKYNSPEMISETIEAVNEKAEEIISGADSDTVFEYLKYFNEWLITNNEYNYYIGFGQMGIMDVLQTYPDVFECTSALFGNTGYDGPVCEAYARAMKVLCDKMGIPCVLVDGFALNGSNAEGESHMWNYVQIDNKWYAVDATWNDPLVTDGGASSGYENEIYFLIGADTETAIGDSMMPFIESHPAENQPYGKDSLAFTNGPVLNGSAYDPALAPPPCTHGNTEIRDIVQSTCITNGYTGNTYCLECGLYIEMGTDQELSDHSYEISITKATIGADGSIDQKCKYCDHIASREVLCSIASVILSNDTYIYDGSIKAPGIIVKNRNGEIIGDENYNVAYADGCQNPGSYAVKVAFCGNYEGSEILYLRIYPSAKSFSSVSANKNGFIAKWKKDSLVSGYEIQYSTKKTFNSKVTKTISNKSVASLKVKKLKAQDQYYVRIRTFKNVTEDGTAKKLYSGWSEIKSVITENAKGQISGIKSVKLSKNVFHYNGQIQKPKIVIKDKAGNTLTENTDYTVTYSKGSQKPGKYKATVKYKGNYAKLKKVTLTYRIKK